MKKTTDLYHNSTELLRVLFVGGGFCLVFLYIFKERHCVTVIDTGKSQEF